jgi:hypothetical protein
LVWGAQLELGSTATPYQKRVNFLDVTEAGKRSIRRLYFNGTSHFMQTPTITPNTDKAQVFAGVRKLSDAASGVLCETSSIVNNNDGSLLLAAPSASGANSYLICQRNSIPANWDGRVRCRPDTSVVSLLADIPAPLYCASPQRRICAKRDRPRHRQLPRLPMFIGARAGTSLFFNGYLDQLITRFGTNLDSGAIETTEKYVSTKSPELVAASEVTWNASTDTYTQNLVGLGR